VKVLASNKWILLGSSVFIGLNFLFILKDQWLFGFIPFALILAYLSVIRMDWAFLFAAFSAPLSFNLEYLTDGKLGLYMPTEPLLAILLVLIVAKEIHRPFLPRTFFAHPAFYATAFYLFWLVVTSITSTHPLVSFKFLLVRLWFFIPILFFGVHVFREEKNIKRFIWLFTIGMSLVIAYTLIHHYQYNFAEKQGHWVMWPFFKDHTGYGAMVAFIIPFLFSLYRSKKHSLLVQVTLFGLITLALIGVYFSYTRAAWLSLIAALLVWIVLKLKIHFKYLAFVGILAGVVVLTQWDRINMELARNKSEHTTEDFGTRLQSTANVTSDASNLERINRWTAALEMFKARPWFGFGPGTYAFEYAPYQHPDNLTIISTNFGNLGNAHSEYLGPLAETGWIGALSFIMLVITVFYTGITLYIRYPEGEMKTLVMGMILALVTYFTHGILNNYLDTDKAAIPVWGVLAAFVALQTRLNQVDSGTKKARN
jgi:putative inorganic carbon (hco3(-)) transporter